jgi:hypothetical protein
MSYVSITQIKVNTAKLKSRAAPGASLFAMARPCRGLAIQRPGLLEAWPVRGLASERPDHSRERWRRQAATGTDAFQIDGL